MKYLKILNTIAFIIPFIIGIGKGIKEQDAGVGIIVGLMSTLITGIIQLFIALIYFYHYPGEKLIKIYFLGVIVFFSFLIFTKSGNDWYWSLPPVLFLLLSYIIYSKKENPVED